MGAIPLDFDVDRVRFGSNTTRVPKFVKAVLRISKMVASEKKKLVLIYPNSTFEWTPLLASESPTMKSSSSLRNVVSENRREATAGLKILPL